LRQVLAQKLVRLRVQQPHAALVVLHEELPTDVARRRRVVGALDLHVAVEVHGALAVAVVAKRFDRQRREVRLLLGKHRGDLALGRAVDARVRPALVPVVEVALRVLRALEAQPLEHLLRVPDPRLHLPFAIGVAYTARQRERAIVREDVAVERIEPRIVDVRREHALAKVVEDGRARRSAEATKRFLVQLAPKLCARSPREQAYRLAAVAERHEKEAHPAVLARLRIAHHRAYPFDQSRS
jgi:hypothetical protein